MGHRLGVRRQEQRAGFLFDPDAAKIEGLVAWIEQPRVGEEVDQRSCATDGPLDAVRPNDRRRRSHDRVGGVPGGTGGFRGRKRSIADEVDFRRHKQC